MGPKIEGTPDFIWRGWSKDFFEFEIFDSGIIFIRKILIHVGIFLRIQNNLKLSFCIKLVMKQKMFLGVSSVVSEKAFIDIRHGIFSGGGVNFSAGIFLRFVRNPMDFFQGGEGWFLSAFEHPCNLKSGVLPPPENRVPQKKLLHSK